MKIAKKTAKKSAKENPKHFFYISWTKLGIYAIISAIWVLFHITPFSTVWFVYSWSFKATLGVTMFIEVYFLILITDMVGRFIK